MFGDSLPIHNLMLRLTPHPNLKSLHGQCLPQRRERIQRPKHHPRHVNGGVVEGDVGGDEGVVGEQERVDGGGLEGEVHGGLVVAWH